MAVQNNFTSWTISAAANLLDNTAGTGKIYKAIAFNDSNIANNGKEASGIIQHTENTAGNITISTNGIMKYTAAKAITAGQRLTCTTSGYMTTVDSGLYCVGRNGFASVASGAVGTGVFDFSMPAFITSCADLPA